jgi:hypothetical protein
MPIYGIMPEMDECMDPTTFDVTRKRIQIFIQMMRIQKKIANKIVDYALGKKKLTSEKKIKN